MNLYVSQNTVHHEPHVSPDMVTIVSYRVHTKMSVARYQNVHVSRAGIYSAVLRSVPNSMKHVSHSMILLGCMSYRFYMIS
jgi:hypothetical protein